jgi:hypothetical protein
MTRLVAGLAAAALLTPLTAQAQVNRTVIRDSGNGANNTISVRNGPARHGFPGYQPPIALHAPAVPAYQPVGYPEPYSAGFAPAGYNGFGGPAFNGFGGGGFGGPTFNRNLISNSGNGANNVISLVNRGGFGYNPAAPFPYGMGGFGVNVNVVTNSGNGVGNTIQTFNRGGPGGVNINVITNSGNGIGNVIGVKNR